MKATLLYRSLLGGALLLSALSAHAQTGDPWIDSSPNRNSQPATSTQPSNSSSDDWRNSDNRDNRDRDRNRNRDYNRGPRYAYDNVPYGNYRYRNDERVIFRDSDVGAFGSFLMEFGQLNGGDNFVTFTGGGGALTFNKSFFFGGYGQSLVGGVQKVPAGVIASTGRDDLQLSFGHGGFWLGAAFSPRNSVHVTFSTKLGWGGASWEDPSGNTVLARDRVFVVSPAVGVEANIFTWMKIDLSGGYRIVSGLNIPGMKSNDLDGFNANLAFKFGGW